MGDQSTTDQTTTAPPRTPSTSPEQPASRREQIAVLSEEQQETYRLLREFRDKAQSRESLQRGKQMAEEFIAELRTAGVTAQFQQMRIAQEALNDFNARLTNPTWRDTLYENKEVILAGAALVAIASFFVKGDSKPKRALRWGMRIVAGAALGVTVFDAMEERELAELAGNRRTGTGTGTPSGQPGSQPGGGASGGRSAVCFL